MKSSFFKFFSILCLLPIGLAAREPGGYVGPRYIVAEDFTFPPESSLGLPGRRILGSFDFDAILIADGTVATEVNPLTSAGGTTVPAGIVPQILQISSRDFTDGSLSGTLRVSGKRSGQSSVAVGPDSDDTTLELTFTQGIGGLELVLAPINGWLEVYINGVSIPTSIALSNTDNVNLTILDPLGASIRSVAFARNIPKMLVGKGTIYGDLPPLCRPIPDLLISNRSPTRLKGDDVYDRKRPSRKQTIVHDSHIFTKTQVAVQLWMENDGGETARMNLRSSGDRFPGMTAHAQEIGRDGRKNITAALKRGNFSAMVEPGYPVKVSYSLKVNRYWAGVLRGGDRNDTIRFRLSSAGRKDNAAMVVKYR